MTLRLLLLLLFASLHVSATAQKTAYIPNYLLNPNTVDGGQFTWSKTRQSTNFTLIWGNTVGLNPANYPDPNLAFNPEALLDTMEWIYTAFKGFGFLDDAPGTNLNQYKIPIVMYGTWGPNGAQGFANGGDADGVIGAFWVHPTAMKDGAVAAHELTHSLQAQCNIDYRAAHGLGNVWLNAGIFWETHANFMRNLLYPKAVSAWGMDVYHTETWGDWKNTYENYELLLAIMESEGIDMVNRLWRESFSNEYPLQAYKRLAGYDQAQFNDSLFHYARRMATFDFNYNNIGAWFRQYRNADLANHLPSVQATYSILRKIPGAEHRYEIPIEQAPEEFAYNVIPLYPEADSCAVIIKFKGHTEANPHTGWRYGFVAAYPNGTLSRYSPTYSENTREINFQLQGNETRLFLVVMGAPFDQITTNTTNDTWHGYPKHFRHPYELTISGAQPEGFQNPATFRAQLKFNGHVHPNGGGWIQNSASVANSVYVGPAAMVLGNANISGDVRIENTALVRNAVVSGQVRIRDNAFVDRGNYSGSTVVQGQGFAENVTMSNNALIGMRAKVTNYKLSGTVEVGGDVVVYNENGNCNNGVHYRLTNYYDNKLLECDGRTANHPANKDVNDTYPLFSNEIMALQCQCAYDNAPINVDSIAIAPVSCLDAAAGAVAFFSAKSCAPLLYAWSKGPEQGANLSGLTAGNYVFSITDALGRQLVLPIDIPPAPVLTATLSATPYDCATDSGATASVDVVGAAWPVTYTWDNGATGATSTGLFPGSYSVTATDAQGCTFSAAVQVHLSGHLNTSLTTTPISCHDQADGTATFQPLHGIAPYTWSWQDGDTSSQRTNLGAGVYAATITDAIGCTDQLQFSLTAPEALNLEIQGPPALCPTQQDNLVATATGGVMPYQFIWNNTLSDSVIAIQGSGAYTVTVTDAQGCTHTGIVEIVPGGALELSAVVTPIRCFGGADGTVEIQALSGVAPFQWHWESGETDSLRTNLGAGAYTVTVTDALGCSHSIPVSMTAPPPLLLQVSAQATRCFGEANGLAAVAVSGGAAGYSFLWNNQHGGDTITGLLAGIYSVTVTDQNGCSQAATVLVESPTAIGLQFEAPSILCAGMEDQTIAVAFGGAPPYSYQWSTGTTGDTLLSMAGSFTVSVADGQGCTHVQTVEIPEASAVTNQATIQHATSVLANDGAVWVTDVSGGVAPYVFHWSTGAGTPSLENIPPGAYTLSITDAAGCTWIFTYTVSFETQVQPVEQLDIQVQIVPNPGTSVAELWLELPQAKHLTIRILDALGRVLYVTSDSFQAGRGSMALPTGFAAGTYRVQVSDKLGRQTVLVWMVL